MFNFGDDSFAGIFCIYIEKAVKIAFVDTNSEL